MTEHSSHRFQQLISFLEESPDDPFLLFALAKEYEKLEDQKNALVLYEKLAREHPAYVGAWYHYGNLLRILGRESEAQEVFQLGIYHARKANDAHAVSELQRIAAESG